MGAVLGTLGWGLFGWIPAGVRLLLLSAVLVAGVVAERGWLGSGLPTTRRQVNEQWMHAYRGWVYGIGYGLQLGAGVATVVTSAAVYATLASELLVGNVPVAIAIGAVFGGIRGLSLLPGVTIAAPAQLVRLDGFFATTAAPAAAFSRAAQGLLAAVCLILALRLI